MEAVFVFRQLRRRMLLVVAGAVVAVAIALAMGPSPTPPWGYAATQVLLDTSPSQLVKDAPAGAETLYWRATLAAGLLGTNASRDSIAREVGIPPNQLTVTDLEFVAPYIPATLPRAATQAAFAKSEPYALTVSTDNLVPIISIAASAPDRGRAVRLIEAAVHSLQQASSATASGESIGLTIQTATPVDSVQIPGAAGRKKMAALAVVVFGLWITAMIFIPALRGALRTLLHDADAARL